MGSRGHRAIAGLLCTAAVLGAGLAVGVSGASAGAPCGSAGSYSVSGSTATCTWSSATDSGVSDSLTVPVDVADVTISAVGGEGGGAAIGSGGFGESVSGTYDVGGGTVLAITVAGNGASGPSGGSGGFGGGGSGGSSVYGDGGGGGGASTVLDAAGRGSSPPVAGGPAGSFRAEPRANQARPRRIPAPPPVEVPEGPAARLELVAVRAPTALRVPPARAGPAGPPAPIRAVVVAAAAAVRSVVVAAAAGLVRVVVAAAARRTLPTRVRPPSRTRLECQPS